MGEYIVIFCTVPAKDIGIKIGDSLVKKRLAACANIVGGLTSIYEWKGEICKDEECLMIIKSRNSLFDSIKDEIVSLHPYELPEVISMDISNGLEPYLKWIESNTAK